MVARMERRVPGLEGVIDDDLELVGRQGKTMLRAQGLVEIARRGGDALEAFLGKAALLPKDRVVGDGEGFLV